MRVYKVRQRVACRYSGIILSGEVSQGLLLVVFVGLVVNELPVLALAVLDVVVHRLGCGGFLDSPGSQLTGELIPDYIYNKLDPKRSFNDFLVEEKEDAWGQIKGGCLSSGTTKDIRIPKKSKRLAEFVGIVLGDGNIFVRKGSGVYQIRIAKDAKNEKEYLGFVARLSRNLFGIEPIIVKKGTSAHYVCIDSKRVVEFLIDCGMCSGNKVLNMVGIPKWIKIKDSYLRACIRGLIDTDGSIFKMSKRDSNLLRINFRNYNPVLLEDVRIGLLKLGYTPSKVIKGTMINISRENEISKYLKAIGFNNQKHIQRYERFTSPVV